jgi:hypothetical protein
MFFLSSGPFLYDVNIQREAYNVLPFVGYLTMFLYPNYVLSHNRRFSCRGSIPAPREYESKRYRYVNPSGEGKVTRWGWAASFTPRPLYLRGTSAGTHSTESWVGPRAGLDLREKRKISCPLPWIEPRFLCLASSLVAILTELRRLLPIL